MVLLSWMAHEEMATVVLFNVIVKVITHLFFLFNAKNEFIQKGAVNNLSAAGYFEKCWSFSKCF